MEFDLRNFILFLSNFGCDVLLKKVGAQTETELKEKKLRVEDALNATKVIYKS